MRIKCQCGARYRVPDECVGQSARCAKCRAMMHFVAGAPYAPGGGDFEARLVVESGHGKAGEQFLLGGSVPIEIGKKEGKPILLTGERVSRDHGVLVRMDGPRSGWRYEDQDSTNGSFVDGVKVTIHDLRPGDSLRIGEYHLRYFCEQRQDDEPGPGRPVAPPAPAPPEAPDESGGLYDIVEPPPAPPRAETRRVDMPGGADDSMPPARGDGPVCPSCQRTLNAGAKICVACGIHVKTGRPLVTAREIDENDLEIRAQTTLRFISWIIPIGPFYPIASEAYGGKKPYAVWTIAILTAVASIAYWASGWGRSGPEPGRILMLWPNREADVKSITLHEALARGEDFGDDEAEAEPAAPVAKPPVVRRGPPRNMPLITRKDGQTDEEMLRAAVDKKRVEDEKKKQQQAEFARLVAEYRSLPEEKRAIADFHWYQLITHAFLHGDIFHIAGNMLFLLVFGSRVNALIGNLQAAIVYPLLAVAAGVAHMVFDQSELIIPSLGASGAIMGLAGMYFVLFPIHKVHMVSWIRLGIFTGFRLYYKIYAVRGFWVVLLYIAFDVVATLRQAHDGVAHWAHLGGFIVGIVFALILLLSRLVNARGADILSIVLGRYAWPLLGKPSTR